ncbi:MAG: hypothetical protein KBT02_13040 [Treponema sp.]|nr:hypothetical protein [Candidatus Treponema caballi]
MKPCKAALAVFLLFAGLPLFGATALENATAYTESARKSYNAGYTEVASEYAETALVYCESSSDAWYLKALCDYKLDSSLSLVKTIETLEKCFSGGAFFVNESEYDVRMWLSRLCYTTGNFKRAAEVLTEDPSVTEDKLLLLTRIWYAAGEKEKARECVETGIQMYPFTTDFYCNYFMNEVPDEVKETPLCERLVENVALFNPEDSDIYLYASQFVDEETSERYVKTYGQYRGSSSLYPIYALQKGFMTFEEALSYFDARYHNAMLFEEFEMLCSMASEDDLSCLYAFLDGFDGIILFDAKGTGLRDMICIYRYGRPYYIYYDESCDNDTDMVISCDYGTPDFVYLPSGNTSLSYNRFPSVSHITFSNPAVSLSFALNASSWNAVIMEKASFSTDDFAFYIPQLADSLGDVSTKTFISGCSTVECTTDNPEDCSIRIVMNAGKPVDAFYMVHDRLYAHAYFSDGKLLYRDVDMDGDGLFELSEQYLYDAPEPDSALIGNRIYGTVADCFECPRFSALLSDGDGDGVYEYEETMNPDGTSEKVWY